MSEDIASKDFKCDYCGKLFSEKGNLLRHQKNIHYWCRYCDEYFGDVKEVNEHQNLIHGITKGQKKMVES